MYIDISELRNQVPNSEYNKGAIAMLEFISSNEGWEDSETKYFNDFYKDIL